METGELRTAMLDAMVKKAEEIYAATPNYHKGGKRGYFNVEIRNSQAPDQWDASSRPFGRVASEPATEEDMIINNGGSFETTVRGKVAYTRRTGKNSGANHWEVRGTESWWKGALISADGNCISAFSGLMGYDDIAIAQAGIDVYNSR
ncbi:MAG: hypothetical protein LBT39_01295 [Treponema sp.]|jgi:hypothetical protein|nr:hypothetical protein [Treponema sp.]